jgi:hypothetical protein
MLYILTHGLKLKTCTNVYQVEAFVIKQKNREDHGD